MDFYNQKEQLKEYLASLRTSEDALNVSALNAELSAIKIKQENPDYWQNADEAKKDGQRLSFIEKKLGAVSALNEKIKYLSELFELAELMQDNEVKAEADSLLVEVGKESEALFLETLMNGKYDNLNAILSLHAGAGGTEAQDWAEMLYRMYSRYAERAGFIVTELDRLQGDEAGIKSASFLISGNNAYGFLKAEKGVHRLVRISPFDSNKRRHTSFASLEVMPEILDSNEITINPEELRIDTLRSGGAGGQHVNKTESAVRITHLPTGIVTQCQNERSQIQNRETAMKMLISKLTEKRERELLERDQSIKGDIKKIEWGSQIRSYVFCPYTLVKDHRTAYENTNVGAVMDGDIEGFIFDYLKRV
ncbi:MAG: peptide chain release factor 2 [Firmicutes bacterium]|nr:peptide chain release factor 2 [Bacillota bacterium]